MRKEHDNIAAAPKPLTRQHLDDPDALQAYHAKWIGEEKAKWFLSLRFNEHTNFKPDDCMSDELESLVR